MARSPAPGTGLAAGCAVTIFTGDTLTPRPAGIAWQKWERGCSILAPSAAARLRLAVEGGVDGEEDVEQIGVGDGGRVKYHVDCLGVPGPARRVDRLLGARPGPAGEAHPR